jgi:hypothetical protein
MRLEHHPVFDGSVALSDGSPGLRFALMGAGLDPDAWPRAVAALREAWAAVDATPLRTFTLAADGRKRIIEAVRAYGAARRAAEAVEYEPGQSAPAGNIDAWRGLQGGRSHKLGCMIN